MLVNEVTIVFGIFAGIAIAVHMNTEANFVAPEIWSKNVATYCGENMLDPESANFQKFYNFFCFTGILLGSWIE